MDLHSQAQQRLPSNWKAIQSEADLQLTKLHKLQMGHQLLNASWLVMTRFEWVHKLDKLHTTSVNRVR